MTDLNLSEPTARDELVTLLIEHVHGKAIGQCACGHVTAGKGHRTAEHRAHLADVLIAAGWTKGDA